jgi:uncharacterized protein YggE
MSFKDRLLLVVVSAALILTFFAARPNVTVTPALAAGDCDSSRTIQVSGSATVKVIPDLVTIQLGVTSNAATPQGVYDQNTAAMKRTVAAIRALGVAEKDISTDYYIIQPIYQNYDALDIKGYRIHNTIIVNLKDVSKVSQVLAAALTAGANEVVDVQFKTSQLRQHRDKARELAMRAAQEKARDLANAANAQPGCVLNIDENSWSYYGYPWQSGRYFAQGMLQNTVQNASGSDQPPSDDGPISLGQIAVQAEVQVRFSLK